MDNRVELIPFEPRSKRDRCDDHRPQPGSPLQVGERATLCFRAEPTEPSWPDWEYVSVTVTEAHGKEFRGTVESDPLSGFISPMNLHRGLVLTFRMEHVYDMMPKTGQ